jgi:transposase
MVIDVEKLPDNTNSLKGLITDLVNKYHSLENEKKEQQLKYEILEEKFLTLQSKFFGSRSEKLNGNDEKQMWLFNEAELGSSLAAKEEKESDYITIAQHKRKKKGRKPLPAGLPRREIKHDLDEEEKNCPCCGKERPCIGQEETEELDIIPARIEVLKHIVYKYGPCDCEGFKARGIPEIKAASKPERLIPGSIVSPGLLAYILVNKFADSLPFYRQEKIFGRIGVEISRATMCNWTIRAAGRCVDLIDLFWQEIRSGPLIQMDETTVQVLKEAGREAEKKSYMWVTIGYKGDKKIIIYHYHQTRSGKIPLEILKAYEGYLQTDGYEGYNECGKQPGIKHAGCFAHARRKFFDASKLSKNTGSAHEALSYIRKIYVIEKQLRAQELSREDFVKKRKELVQPVLQRFNKWLKAKSIKVPPQIKLGQAVLYTLKEWPKLIRYLDEWFLTPDNNTCEQAIRPFVVGRKNWLFSDTPKGAYASAAIYSIIETAKANGLEPYAYLRYLFTNLPLAKTEEDLRKLLPINLDSKQLYKNVAN